MSSRYDYPDPGSDPEYCNDLTSDEGNEDFCLWCNAWFNLIPPQGASWPYCSPLCAAQAAVDSEDK